MVNSQLISSCSERNPSGFFCREGVVNTIDAEDGRKGTVVIESKSACSACHLKGSCTTLDSQEKILNVSFQDGYIAVGDRVAVMMKESLGWMALLIGIIVPLLVLMATILIFFFLLDFSETTSALLGLGALIPYYLALGLFHHGFSKQFILYAKKINS